MKQVQHYIRKHHEHMNKVFLSMGKDQQLEATKVFLYLQEVFQLEQCVFQYDGENYFRNDQNSNHMETLIEAFWKFLNPGDKFYMYRIRFSFEQIGELIEYWIKNDRKLRIIYGQFTQGQQQQVQSQQENHKTFQQAQNQSSNLLIQQSQNFNESLTLTKQNRSRVLQKNTYQNVQAVENIKKQIDNYQTELSVQQNEEKKKEIQEKIQSLNNKIIKIQEIKGHINNTNNLSMLNFSVDSPRKTEQQDSKKQIINYKQIFDFYAKQTHFIGGKVTFGRIQHETNTINYQKFVHFLRQFQLLPQSLRIQKRIHHAYVRCCLSTRDLNLQGFVRLIGNIPQIVIGEGKNYDQKEKIMQMKIFEKAKLKFVKKKNLPKLLNKPFHALEKQDFRIDQSTLKYEFKIIPQPGKTENDIIKQLQQRKNQKQQQKKRFQKVKQQQKIRYLRKLQSIDPFDPMVVNNPLLQVKERYPVASLENIERFRDNSLDFKKKFGIQDIQIDLMQDLSSSIGVESYRKAIKIEKQENQKMKNLMSGIIQRSQLKIQRFSPVKGMKR